MLPCTKRQMKSMLIIQVKLKILSGFEQRHNNTDYSDNAC